MKKMWLVILFLFLISACTPKSNISEPNNSINETEDRYNEENLYLNPKDNTYAYLSNKLDVNENTKPLLTKIATEITEKQLLKKFSNEFDDTSIKAGKYMVYFVFNTTGEFEYIITNYFTEETNNELIYRDTLWIKYLDNSYINSKLSIPLDIGKDASDGDIIAIHPSNGDNMNTNYYILENNELHEIEKEPNDNNSTENIFKDILKYHINKDVENEVKKVIYNDPRVQYYLKVNNYNEIKIIYKNKLEVFADDESIPFLTIWQNKLGEFSASFDFRYIYDFTYIKDNEERKAKLYFVDSYGGYLPSQHPKYSKVKLIANNQEFHFYYRDSEFTTDYITPIIFTSDLQTKLLNYFNEFFSISYEPDYTLSITIGNIIKEKGTPYTYTPIKMGECIDERINEFDSITPLISRECNDGNTYNITPYYQVEIGNLYGLVNEAHELVLPIVNNPIFVWFNKDMFNVEWNIPNDTIYRISGGYGGAYNLYMHDNKDVYMYGQGDDGPSSVTKSENFSSKHISIPVELITIIDSTKNEWGSYNYDYESTGYGMMDSSGNVLTTNVYDKIANVLDDYVYVCKDGLYAFLNTKGEEIIPFIYEDAMYVYNNQSVVMKDGKYGAITMNNDVVVEFKYEKLSYFGKNCYVGLINNKWEIIYIK